MFRFDDGRAQLVLARTVRPVYAVDVLVDGQQRLGPLAYRVPSGLAVGAGDAVEVPFGRRKAFGVVLGAAATPAKATKDVFSVFGRRVNPLDLEAAANISVRHFTPEFALATRCAPTSAKGAPPLSAGDLRLTTAREIHVGVSDKEWRFVQRAPLVDPAALAAQLATELAERHGGQVLVLCPTVPMVESVVAQFESGAARLDAAAARGAWRGFVDGQVRIGVGTRAAALYSAADIAGFVVMEADHVGHNALRQPYVHAAELVRERARIHGVPVVMTGTCPPPGLLGNVRVVQAGSPSDMPKVSVVSRAGRDVRRVFPPAAQVRIQQSIRGRQRVLVVCDQAARIRCSSCRAVWKPSDISCGRCNGREQTKVGWDKQRVESFFNDKVRAVTFDELVKLNGADLVVLFDVDAPMRRATLSPQRDVANLVLAAAASCGAGGEVLCVTDTSGDSRLLDAFCCGDLREIGRVVWSEAKSMQLPPFGELVEVHISGRKTAPDVRQFPGKVAGPHRVGDGEWEILVRCSKSEMTALASVLDVWRSRYKMRVTRK